MRGCRIEHRGPEIERGKACAYDGRAIHPGRAWKRKHMGNPGPSNFMRDHKNATAAVAQRDDGPAIEQLRRMHSKTAILQIQQTFSGKEKRTDIYISD